MKTKITLMTTLVFISIVYSQAQVVTNTNDSGPGSLRQAIIDANALPGTGNITFNIPGFGPYFIISLASALPEITDPVIIDGYTQPGASPATETKSAVIKIGLDGYDISSGASGLYITAGNCTVKGLAIHRFRFDIEKDNGIVLAINGYNTIEGNIIGIDYNDGLYTSMGIAGAGIKIISGDGNHIGGPEPYQRNIISDNRYGIYIGGGVGHEIMGNYIGTNILGKPSFYNFSNEEGIVISSGNAIIGGTIDGAGNLISGNLLSGIKLSNTNGVTIQGNLIGTDVTGAGNLGNDDGIVISGSNYNCLIGGSVAEARNIISGNKGNGIYLWLIKDEASNYQIKGNFIGTDLSGTANLGNKEAGVALIAVENITVGGTLSGEGNLISGNNTGILIEELAHNYFGKLNKIIGNHIGTDINGTARLGNSSYGIKIFDAEGSNIIGGLQQGAGNTISGNGIGIFIDASMSNQILGNSISLNDFGICISNYCKKNAILSNSIYSNGSLGIHLGGSPYYVVTPNDPGDTDDGTNGLQNYPVLTSVETGETSTRITGSLNSMANSTFRIQLFVNNEADRSGYGEGETLIGETTITTDAGGNATIDVTLPSVVPQGAYITATATSSDNNTSEFSKAIITGDMEPPVLSGIPADVTVECNAVPSPAAVTAIDNVDGNVPVSYAEDKVQGRCNYSYRLIRTWTSTDAAGNIASDNQTITVNDTEAPVISSPADTTISCEASSDPSNTGKANATDNCDPGPAIIYADEKTAGSCINNSTIKRTWTATDACGNTNSSIQVITIVDSEPPILICPADLTIECDDPSDPSKTGLASATDNCDENPIVKYSDEQVSGICGNDFLIIRKWTATDVCGNVATNTQNISVVDEAKPVITGVPTSILTKGNDPGKCGAVINYPVMTATDNCSGNVTLSAVPVSGSFFSIGTTSVSVTAVDACGNTETAYFYVEVTNDKPVLGIITAPVDPIQTGASVYASSFFADNNISEASWDWGDGSTSAGMIGDQNVTGVHQYEMPGVYTLTLMVTDMCGETCTEIYNYVVIYDPFGGFVTGGGWIYSLPGDYLYDPLLEGKANFGFVSKYKKGTTTPEGNTEFQFKAGNLNFNSSSYDWLVIAGSKAIFKGTGTINGTGNYGFILSAVDGDLKNTGEDRFRIKIWNKNNDEVVYDNEYGESVDADPNTIIGDGAIVIHTLDIHKSSLPLSETGSNAFKVYPNPFNDQINVDLSWDQTSRVFIDLVGPDGKVNKMLYRGRIDAGTSYHFVFEFGSETASGVYILRIGVAEGIYLKKEVLIKVE